jgi:hypothetical protein
MAEVVVEHGAAGAPAPRRRPRLSAAGAIILAPAVATLLLHLVLSAVQPYGYFRDEFYYVACSQRLAWGYVDHPPLLPLLTRLVTTVLGDSITALRLLPAVTSAAFVAISPIMAREFGGGRRAISIAAVASAIPLVYLIHGGLLSPIALDHLIWAASALCLLRLLKTGDPRYWIPVGVLVGIGLENKHNAAFLAAAIAVGTLATSNRKYLRGPHVWAGAGLALLIALPQLLWQIDHGWPTIEFARNAASEKNALGNMVDLPLVQVFAMNPLTFPIWITGLWWTLFSREGKRYRMLGLLWVVPFLLFVVQGGSRPDYLTPAYPALLAAGAVAIAGWRPFARSVWAPGATVLALVAGGLALLPLGVSVLPVGQAESYVRALGLDEMEMEEGKTSVLPQWQADRFGWKEMTAKVAEVYRTLPEEEQAQATILTENYGEAGAINFFGDKYGLPEAISGHNNHYLWGPGEATGELVVGVGLDEDFLQQHFDSVQIVAVFTCEHCTSDENGLRIYLARSPRQPLPEMWAAFKHYG